MLDQFNERLMRAKSRWRSKQKLESMMRETQARVQREQARCSSLQDALAKEEADVDKLEGLSLTGLFHSVLGTKDDRLHEERQEYLAAKLKFDEASAALADAQSEVKRLRDELDELVNAETEYRQIIEQKEELLAKGGGKLAEQLLTKSEEIADLTSDKNELAEAVQAGESALNSLRQVSSDLSSAANWGTFDLIGGGMLSTMAKHSKIDSAKEHAHRAQRRIRRFQEELADADQRLNVSLEIGGFAKFADFFFDGLIADWVVQSKIKEASAACSSAINRVSAAVNTCRRRLKETDQQVEKALQEKQALVEAA